MRRITALVVLCLLLGSSADADIIQYEESGFCGVGGSGWWIHDGEWTGQVVSIVGTAMYDFSYETSYDDEGRIIYEWSHGFGLLLDLRAMGYRWSTSGGGAGGEFGSESDGSIGGVQFFHVNNRRIGAFDFRTPWDGYNHWTLDENNGILPYEFGVGGSASVPDPSSTYLLMGLAIVGLRTCRKRWQ